MGKQAPAPPDFKAAAEATARSARPDVNTPYAQQRWVQGPDGQWTNSIGFTGGLGDAAASLQQQAGQAMATPFSFGQFGDIQTGDAARDQAIKAAYEQSTSRLNPMRGQREDQLRTRLANQGLDVNSEAARNAMSEFNLGRNDAYTSALNSAIGQGTAAGSAAFNQNMAARQQAISEALRQRDMPLQELQQMQGLLQMPNTPGPTNYLGAAESQYGADMQRYQLEQQQQAELWKNIMALGGAGLGFAFGGPIGAGIGGSLGSAGGAGLANLSTPVPFSF